MNTFITKAQNAILYATGIAMAATIGMFGLFLIGGAFLVSLVAIPLGLLTMFILGQQNQATNEFDETTAQDVRA